MEKKSIPYSERKFDKSKKQSYDTNYKKDNLDQIVFTAPKGTKDLLKQQAAAEGLSLAEYIRKKLDL